MPTPVRATKLRMPALRPEMVARPRIIAAVEAGLGPGHKLTLVSAPAGFGKTTALRAWLAPSAQRHAHVGVAWLSLDEPTAYELRVGGHLDDHWSAWFGCSTLTRESDGTTTLRGPVVRDLGLTLISVQVVDDPN